MFKEGKLCIPQGSIRKLLVKESHEDGLMGHFGIDKMSISIALGVWLVYKPSLG